MATIITYKLCIPGLISSLRPLSELRLAAGRYYRGVPKPSESKLKSRARAVPWAMLLQGGVIVGERWAALSAKERERLVRLARQSRGRVSNLSAKERLELGKLARRLDVKGIGRDLLQLVRPRGRGRKRR